MGHIPKISIVTPSFNQAELLEETIDSVLSQGYPNLEYIIVDGGSKDSSIDVIKKYADKLAWWVSGPDKGRGDAVNKGFKRSTGEIMAWMGCGDKYFPGAFSAVSRIFSDLPQVEWLTTGGYTSWNSKGEPSPFRRRNGFSSEAFKKGCYLPMLGTLQQESTFWRRSLWERSGSFVNENFPLIPDFELWARFFKHAEVYATHTPLGGIREHPGQNKSLRRGFNVGRKVLKKYYKADFILLRAFLSFFKRHPMQVVEYNFHAQRWYTKKIKVYVFEDIIKWEWNKCVGKLRKSL